MTAPTWSLLADFNRDGVYEFDLRPYVDAGAQLRVSRGVDRNGRMRVSTLEVSLDNQTGIFTPEYSSSSLYGLLKPDVPIQLAANFSSTDYTLWTGYAQSWTCKWAGSKGIGARCQLSAIDLAGAFLKDAQVNVVSSTSRSTSDAIAAIMVAAGLSSSDYNLDAGIQSLPFHFVRAQKALDAIMDAVYSEMGGTAWIQADGKLRFENRHARLGTTVDATWGDSTNVIPENVAYEVSTNDLVTSASVSATIFTTGQDNDEILRFTRGMDTRGGADSIAIAAGASYEAEFDYGVAAVSITAAVAVTDYLANTAIDGTGTDKTSALTVSVTDLGGAARIKLTNTDAATIYVTKFRLRGQRTAYTNQSPTFTVTKSVVGMKTDRSLQLRVPFADDSQAAKDFSVALCRTYRVPYPRVTLEFCWDTDDITAAMLAADIGQLVKFADLTSGNAAWLTNVNDWWYIEAIEQMVSPAAVPRTQVTLTPAYTYRNLDAIAYDSFTRSNATGDLGTSLSGDAWANDSGFNIASNAAVPNVTTVQTPNINLGVTDGVAEVSLAGMAS